MWPVLGGLISGGMNLLGGMFSSDTSAQNTQAQIAASKEQQATQNAFTEQMSNTAYQRASKDMQAAGLNPMMMFGSGGPASTPSGSSIQAPMPQKTSPLANLGSAAQQAIGTAVQAKTMDRMTDEMANLKQENEKLKYDTDNAAAQVRRTIAQSELTEKERDRLKALMPTFSLTGTTARDVLTGVNPTVRKVANIAAWGGEKAGDVIAPVVSSAGAVSRMLQGSRNEQFRNRYYFGE